jgi:hypothetical protein
MCQCLKQKTSPSGDKKKFVTPSRPKQIQFVFYLNLFNLGFIRANLSWFGSDNEFMILNQQTYEPDPFKKKLM